MLKKSITKEEIAMIFGRGDYGDPLSRKREYLQQLFIARGKDLPKYKTKEIDDKIMDSWDYEVSKRVLREMFFKTEKYCNQIKLKEKYNAAISQWKNLKLGKFEWRFQAQAFENRVQDLNRREDISDEEKDRILCDDCIHFRRMKELSQYKNDYIEYLIVTDHEDIIPTFVNKKGADYFINGKPYDQKVSKSVGKAFKKEYGIVYRERAIAHPEEVAGSLYENQDKARFGDDPRLFIVFLDDEMDMDDIELRLKNIDFSSPKPVDFEYNGKSYHTECFIVLLYR